MLRNQQQVALNKWKATIHGEERLVTKAIVEWYSETLDEACKSFDPKEVIMFKITGTISDELRKA